MRGKSKSITIACNKDFRNVIALQIHVSSYYEYADDHRIIQDIKSFHVHQIFDHVS